MTQETQTTSNSADHDAQNCEMALIRAVAERRDRNAFTELFNRHRRNGYNLALHITGDRAEAEDAYQDAMLSVWKKSESFCRDGSVRAWLMKIIARQALKTVRQRQAKRKQIVRREQVLPRDEATTATPPEDREQREALRGMVAKLPDVQRQLLALYFGTEMTQTEISEYLSIPQSTVSRRIQAVLDGLRGQLSRAGMAAAPLLTSKSLRALILNAEAPPATIAAGISARLARAGRSLSQKSAAAKATSSVWALLLMLAVPAATGAAWLFLQDPAPLTKSTITPPAHEGPQTAEEPVAPEVLRLPTRWTFEGRKLPRGLSLYSGAIAFGKDKVTQMTALRFEGPDGGSLMTTIPLPDQHFVVEARQTLLNTRESRVSLSLTDGKTVSRSCWKWPETGGPRGSSQGMRESTTVRWYVMDPYIFIFHNDEFRYAMALRRDFKDKYLLIGGLNCALSEITIKALPEEALPPDARESMGWFKDVDLKQYSQRDPISMPRPEPEQSPRP